MAVLRSQERRLGGCLTEPVRVALLLGRGVSFAREEEGAVVWESLGWGSNTQLLRASAHHTGLHSQEGVGGSQQGFPVFLICLSGFRGLSEVTSKAFPLLLKPSSPFNQMSVSWAGPGALVIILCWFFSAALGSPTPLPVKLEKSWPRGSDKSCCSCWCCPFYLLNGVQ